MIRYTQTSLFDYCLASEGWGRGVSYSLFRKCLQKDSSKALAAKDGLFISVWKCVLYIQGRLQEEKRNKKEPKTSIFSHFSRQEIVQLDLPVLSYALRNV